MKIKVGENIKKAVLTSKLSKTDIVKKLQKLRTWLDKILDEEYMPLKYVIQFADVLDMDFYQSIPDLKKYSPRQTTEEKMDNIDDLSFIELKDKMIHIQSKYIDLLEQHLKLLEELKNN